MDKNKNIESTNIAQTDVKLTKSLFQYIKKHPYLITTAICFMLLADIATVMPPYFLKQGLDISVPQKDLDGLLTNTIFLGTFLLLSFIFSVSFNYLIQLIGQKLILNIRMDIFKKVLYLTSGFFDKNPIGTTLTYLTNDVETLKEFISEGFITIVGNSAKVLFILGMMFYIHPLLATISMISIPFFILATLLFKVSLRTAYRGIRKSNAVMNTLLIESITGIKEIILFNHKEKSINKFDDGNYKYQNSYLKVVKTYSLYFPVIEFVSFVSTILILVTAHFTSKEEVEIGEIFAFFFYISMFFRPLRDLAEQLNTFQSAMSAAERIFSFLLTKADFEVESIPSSRSPNKKTISKDSVKGEIVFKNVHFSYVPQKKIIKGVSFKIKSGETIAIVGATGSGKTTLTSLLNRLYDIDSGEILIDGTNIKNIPFHDLRKIISTIPQNIFLFTGNFFENIDLNHEVNQETIIQASKKVGIHPFITKLNKQYEENVLEEGKSISTGQKQLLAFARAFIQSSPIVILDEATANIDSESEKKIQQSLHELTKECTSIIIAHRLSTIKHADRVLVMHQGELVEQGNHQQLIKKNGIYKKLYQMQTIQSMD